MSERINRTTKVTLDPKPNTPEANKTTADDWNETWGVVNSHATDIEELQETQADSFPRYDTVVDEGDGRTFFPVSGDANTIYVATKMDDSTQNGNYDWNGSSYVYSEYQTIKGSKTNYALESSADVFTSEGANSYFKDSNIENRGSNEIIKTEYSEYIGKSIVIDYPNYIIDTWAGNSKKSYVTEGNVLSDSTVDSIGVYFTHIKETRVKVFLNTILYLDTTINTIIGENIIDLKGYLVLKEGDSLQIAYESIDGSVYNLTYVNNPTISDNWFSVNKIALGADVINRDIAFDLTSSGTIFIPVNLYLKNKEYKGINQSGLNSSSSLIKGDYDEKVLSPSANYIYDETSGNISTTKFTYAVMQSVKRFNKVGVFARPVSTDTVDGDLLVKIFVNGILKGQKTITADDLETTSIVGDDSLLIADLDNYIEVVSGDEVCVGYASLGTYKIALSYKSNNTPSDNNEFTRNYNISSNSIDLNSLENAPTRPESQLFFYIPFNLYHTQLKGNIETSNDVIYPHRLYHAVSDSDSTGFTGNYSIGLYVDHFIKKRSVLFDNQKDNISIPANVVRTGDGTAQFNSGVNLDSQTKEIELNDGRSLRYNMKSVIANAQSKDAFVLTIGDSITYGIGTINDITGSTDKGVPFWVTAGQLLDDNEDTYSNIMLGSNRGRDLTGGKRACAEGRSSWSLFNYMRHSTDLKEEPGYRALGYVDAWTRSEAQLAAIATTNEVDPGGIPENPFYDGGLTGSNRFSISKWLERYRTMDDSGNRLSLGDPSLGTEITTQADIDGKNVMTPTHILLALGTNDTYFGTIDTYYSNMMEMITTIKTQLPNCVVGVLPIPDTAGTFYPEFYDIDGAVHTDHSKRFDVYKKMTHNILGAYNEDVDKVYVVPSYFTAPTARAYNLRNVNSVNGDIKQSTFGDDIHVSHYAHDNWAYIIYSWIKYTTVI